MQRLLFNPPKPGLAIYDDVTGDVTGEVPDATPTDDRRSGNCYEVAGRWIGFYARDGALILQIGPDKFPLDAGSTKLEYWHHWPTGVTNFRVADPANKVELSYESWWSRIGLRAEQVKFEPEQDQEEDDLAYVYEVWKNPQMQRELIAQWG